jgi:tyrosinase
MSVILFQSPPRAPEPAAAGHEGVSMFAATAIAGAPVAALASLLSPVAEPPPLQVRKDVYDLTADEIAALRLAFEKVYAISDDRGYQYWAGIHGYPVPIWCQHGTPLFAVWHRPYLYLFEKALQDQVKGVTLPYWDWTSARAQAQGIPAIYTEATYTVGGVSKPNPLLSSAITFSGTAYERTFRDPGPPSGLKPLAGLVRTAQSKTTYETYSPALENPHNGLHGWVGGTMGLVPYAAYDPVFWAHHSNIDRLFAAWQAANREVMPIPSIWNAVLAPFAMATKDIWDIKKLGYTYEPHPVPHELAHPSLASFNAAATSKFNTSLLSFATDQVLGDPRPVELRFNRVKPPKKSFELRVFFNAPAADASTPTEGNPHYAGSLYFFGHGECGGNAGHCDVPSGPRDPFDLRPPHHLSPTTLSLDVGDALHTLSKSASDVTMTLIAVDAKGQAIPDPGTDFASLAIVS